MKISFVKTIVHVMNLMRTIDIGEYYDYLTYFYDMRQRIYYKKNSSHNILSYFCITTSLALHYERDITSINRGTLTRTIYKAIYWYPSVPYIKHYTKYMNEKLAKVLLYVRPSMIREISMFAPHVVTKEMIDYVIPKVPSLNHFDIHVQTPDMVRHYVLKNACDIQFASPEFITNDLIEYYVDNVSVLKCLPKNYQTYDIAKHYLKLDVKNIKYVRTDLFDENLVEYVVRHCLNNMIDLSYYLSFIPKTYKTKDVCDLMIFYCSKYLYWNTIPLRIQTMYDTKFWTNWYAGRNAKDHHHIPIGFVDYDLFSVIFNRGGFNYDYSSDIKNYNVSFNRYKCFFTDDDITRLTTQHPYAMFHFIDNNNIGIGTKHTLCLISGTGTFYKPMTTLKIIDKLIGHGITIHPNVIVTLVSDSRSRPSILFSKLHPMFVTTTIVHILGQRYRSMQNMLCKNNNVLDYD